MGASKTGRLVTWLLFMFLVLVAVIPFGGARAQSEEDRLSQVQRDMDDIRNQIAQAQNDQSEYAGAIERTLQRMEQLSEDLAQAEARLAEAEMRVEDKQQEVNELQRKISQIEANLSETEAELLTAQDNIRRQAAELYMSGSTGWENALFESDRAVEAAVVLEYGRTVVDDVGLLLRSLQVLERQEITFQENLEDEHQRETEALSTLESERTAAHEHAQSVEQARMERRAELASQEGLLAEIRHEITHFEEHLNDLEEEARAIELEILRRQIREGRAPGSLAWPVQGRISSPFGYRIHPILGDRRLHVGIDIAVATGTPIHAAAGGVVILAERWGGYGRAVVLDHGGGLSTLYAHQSSIAVTVGQELAAGDVVGYIGCSGLCTGPHLHFEVREVGQPVDPMQYLS